MYIPLLPHLQPGRQEAGCDEAGRGPLAGPVYAAAVILPPGFSHPLLQDSKMMTERHRLEVRDFIMEKAVGWGVAWCSPEEIDRWNILRASITAMHRALDKLPVSPDYILVDNGVQEEHQQAHHRAERRIEQIPAYVQRVEVAQVRGVPFQSQKAGNQGTQHAEHHRIEDDRHAACWKQPAALDERLPDHRDEDPRRAPPEVIL